MISINLFECAGEFAEDKDVAKDIRVQQLLPAVSKGNEVVIDFNGVELATQSFIHALVSDLIRTYGIDIIDLLVFKGCNRTVRTIINVVIDYMQDTVAAGNES